MLPLLLLFFFCQEMMRHKYLFPNDIEVSTFQGSPYIDIVNVCTKECNPVHTQVHIALYFSACEN